MIIPGMSLPEIGKAIFTDFEGEIRPKMNNLEVLYQRKWVLNGKKDFTETIPFPARSKNDWRIAVRVTQLAVTPLPYLIFYDQVGLTAWHVADLSMPQELMYFNTHFFKRYRERAKLDIEKPEELVKHFFKKNHGRLLPCYTREDGPQQQLFVPLHGGVGLGLHHAGENICEFKTFVDDSLLTEKQKQDVKDIFDDVMNQIMEAFKHVKMPGKPLY